MRTTRRTLLIFGILSVLCIGSGLAPRAAAESDKAIVRVMTRNMDAGTDLNYLVGATSPDLFVLGLQLTAAEVIASDIPGRAEALAAEIEAETPDVVALQEVTTWRIVAGGQTVVLDQLDLLMQAIEASHLPYRIAVSQELTDIPVELPGFAIRYTDHDAILVRTDLPPGHFAVLGTETHIYDHLASFDTPLGAVSVLRGWVGVDLKIRGARFKVADTHLESIFPSAFEQSSALQLAQAMELLESVQAAGMPVILAGDFNSDAEHAGIGPDQSQTAAFISGSGYTDAWRALHTSLADTGFTWPLFLEDQTPGPTAPATPVERIDLIFSLGPVPLDVDRIGTTAGTGGIFASDHAGVVATFALQNFRR